MRGIPVIEKETVDRINALARKAKNEGLSKEEEQERALLRQKYLEGFRANFKAELDRIRFVDEDGDIKREEIDLEIRVEKDENPE